MSSARRAMASSTYRQRGVTFVELIAFIIIAGIVATAMVQTFSVTMRGAHLGKEMTQGTQLAQHRMEVILGQRKLLGYANFDADTFDPCDGVGPAAWAGQLCGTSSYPAGNFNIVSTLSAADACGTGCLQIGVTVDDPYGDRVASVTANVWNY